MKTDKEKFLQYVKDSLTNRLNELGITRYRLIKDANLYSNAPVVNHMFTGKSGMNITTMMFFADLLGMDIVFVPKLSKEETLKKIKKYGEARNK